jgi:hypothetical protein
LQLASWSIHALAEFGRVLSLWLPVCVLLSIQECTATPFRDTATHRGQVGPGSDREPVLPVLRAHAAVRQRPPREVQHLQPSSSGSILQMLDEDAP